MYTWAYTYEIKYIVIDTSSYGHQWNHTNYSRPHLHLPHFTSYSSHPLCFLTDVRSRTWLELESSFGLRGPCGTLPALPLLRDHWKGTLLSVVTQKTPRFVVLVASPSLPQYPSEGCQSGPEGERVPSCPAWCKNLLIWHLEAVWHGTTQSHSYPPQSRTNKDFFLTTHPTAYIWKDTFFP